MTRLLIVLMAILLIGCGKTAPTNYNTSNPVTPAPNTYSVYGSVADVITPNASRWVYVTVDLDQNPANGYLYYYKQFNDFGYSFHITGVPNGLYYLCAFKDMDNTGYFSGTDIYNNPVQFIIANGDMIFATTINMQKIK